MDRTDEVAEEYIQRHTINEFIFIAILLGAMLVSQ